MIKVVLFDVDGVIIAPELWTKQLGKDYGIDPNLLNSFFKTKIQKCLIGKDYLV